MGHVRKPLTLKHSVKYAWIAGSCTFGMLPMLSFFLCGTLIFAMMIGECDSQDYRDNWITFLGVASFAVPFIVFLSLVGYFF